MSINYIRYIEPDAVVGEWLTDREYTGRIKEDLLRRWVSKAGEMIVRTECEVFRLAILTVVNNTADLPKYLQSIYLVGGIQGSPYKIGRMEMTKWVYDKLGTDCEIEVKMNCPECHETNCNHSSEVIELDMDQMHLEQHPHLKQLNMWPFLGYAANDIEGYAGLGMFPQFHIMVPRMSDSAWWNSEYNLGVCNALGPVTRNAHSYHLENGKFITTMKEGHAIISYKAQKRTSEGYLMIPDNTVVVEAIGAYLDMKVSSRAARFGGNQTDSNLYLNDERRWASLRADAINELEMPSAITWEGLIKRHVIAYPDQYHY